MRSRRMCANCRVSVGPAPNVGNRGADIAWMVHCRDCADVVRGRMRLLEHRPSGSSIEFWQCNSCGRVRSCRPGWRTRCPVCLDHRTVLDFRAIAKLRASLGDAEAGFEMAKYFEVSLRDVTFSHMLTRESERFLAEHEERYARPTWTLQASDVRGMPWRDRDPSISHGTWAAHDVCGTVQKITLARAECRLCPPEPGSRTHRAKVGQPHYLYLVRYSDMLKFGHGDAIRVRAHLRAGCQLVQLLRGPHEQVVDAETRIRRTHKNWLIDPRGRKLPTTFGAGSEVVTSEVDIDISSFLDPYDATDVTSSFR